MKQLIFYKIKSILIFLLTFFSIIFFLNISVLAAKIEFSKKAPLNVSSDSMVANKTLSTIEFKGNVITKREDSIIHADSITFHFKKESKEADKNKIEKIIATGNVKYFSGERKAFADKAVYTYTDEILVLTGNMPRVITGKNSVTGEKITLFQKNGRIIIDGGVKATFNPDGEAEQKGE